MAYKRWIVVLILALGVAWWYWSGRPIEHPPGVIVQDAPLQGEATRTEPWTLVDYTFESLGEIALDARVLSKKRYRMDRESVISPYDLALGWGRMSDQAVLDRLDISQGSRWFRWRWYNSSPLPEKEIIASASNFHIIPGNDAVRDALGRIRTGHIITLRGELVRVTDPEGWSWVSSTSRTDTGKGACELVWVEQLTIHPVPQ